MQQTLSRQALLQLHDISQVKRLVGQLLRSPFPVAVWRLPSDDTTHIVVDISSEWREQITEIENLDRCFIINPYGNTHPPAFAVIQSHLHIQLKNGEPEVTLHPSLSADQLDAFLDELDKLPLSSPSVPTPASSHPDFRSIVQQAVDFIQGGEAQKIVVSRFEDFELSAQPDAFALFQAISTAYPLAFCHLTKTAYGTWLGASPERLIEVRQDRFFSTDALAGTQLLAENQPLAQVGWTQKEIEEQALVSRYIINCFKEIRLREFEEIGPRTVKAGNLAHLKTEFNVDMQATNSPQLASTMLNLLHPTSAVCGFPRHASNRFIQQHEGYDRGLYAGFLGPVGFAGNTHLFVNLRCMQLLHSTARLYAGAGITADSDPDREWDETRHKMSTLLKVIAP